YWWGEGVARPRGPSPFLIEARDRCLAGAGVVDVWAARPPDGAANPTAERVARAGWPSDPRGGRRAAQQDGAARLRAARRATRPTAERVARAVWPSAPLGERRSAMEEGAALVRAALRAKTPPPVPDELPEPEREEARRWVYEVDLLLAERARRRRRDVTEVALPSHLSVSQLVALHRDPAALARALRRPLPAAPNPYARRGTAFHLWLEQRFGASGLLDIDELP